MSPRSPQITKHSAERAAGQYDPQSPLFGWPAQTRPEPAVAPSLHVPGHVSAVSNLSASVQWRHRRCCHRVWWSPPLLVRQEAVHSHCYRGARQLSSRSNSLACLAFRPAKIVKLSVMRTLQVVSEAKQNTNFRLFFSHNSMIVNQFQFRHYWSQLIENGWGNSDIWLNWLDLKP